MFILQWQSQVEKEVLVRPFSPGSTLKPVLRGSIDVDTYAMSAYPFSPG
jgi:hypothetical protein